MFSPPGWLHGRDDLSAQHGSHRGLRQGDQARHRWVTWRQGDNGFFRTRLKWTDPIYQEINQRPKKHPHESKPQVVFFFFCAFFSPFFYCCISPLIGSGAFYITALAQRLFPSAFLNISCSAQREGGGINQPINKWQSASLITAASQTGWRILPGDNVLIRLSGGRAGVIKGWCAAVYLLRLPVWGAGREGGAIKPGDLNELLGLIHVEYQ